MSKIKAAIIGCGVISQVYAGNLVKSNSVELVGCADMFPDKAKERAEQFGIKAYESVDALLADPEVQIVINLTIPAAHKEINMKALDAGKHVYCEKPLGISYTDAKETYDYAKSKGLVLAGAPDTVLGAGVQTVKKLIAEGWIGKPLSATVNFTCCGHEIWHPAPEFLYKKGAGPIWDTLVYYIAALTTCLGSVKKVSCFAKKSAQRRMIKSQPMAGKLIDVEVPTYTSGTMVFENDVIVSYTATYDMWVSHLPNFEIYGSEGTVSFANPITFSGEVKLVRGETVMNNIASLVGPEVIETLQSEKAFAWYNDIQLPYTTQGINLRGLGVENLAEHLMNGSELVTNGDFAMHIIEVMEGMDKSAQTGEIVDIISTTPQTEALMPGKGFFI